MRKLAVVSALLLCCASWARGQCTGYTITSTSVNILSPSKAAAQGNAVITLSLTSVDGSMGRSHKVTVGSNDQNILLNWTSQNVTSISFYVSWDSQPSTLWYTTSTASGTDNLYNSNPGHVLNVYAVGSNSNTGQHTQDVVHITITNQAPGVYSQDDIGTNAYYQLVSTFGGGSMMNNCNECQLHPNMCINKTHVPTFDANLTNPQSGETQVISNGWAGNTVSENQSVSGSSSIMISVLPGDTPSGSTTDKIYCSMFGYLLSKQWNPGIPENEFAITEGETIPSTCAVTLRFFETGDSWGVQCKVAWKKPPATNDRCTTASQVPDFNPDTVWDEQDCKTPGNCNTSDMPPPNGTSTTFPKYWYTASWGIRFGGPPAPGQPDPIINGGAHNWVFPIYLADAYIPGGPDEQWWILDLLNIAVAKGTGLPIDCTNRDKGTSPITSPW